MKDPEILIFVGFVFSKLWAIIKKGYRINSWLKVGQVALGIFACFVFYFIFMWYAVWDTDELWLQLVQALIYLMLGFGGELLLFYILDKAEQKFKGAYDKKTDEVFGKDDMPKE